MGWDTCCLPKIKGGLGFGNLTIKNNALLAKWLWRFPIEEDALWHKVISAVYGVSSNGWDPGGPKDRTFRSPWRSVSTVRELFFSRCSWKVFDGSIVRFWEDVWCGDTCLKDRFPSLARLCPSQNAPINGFALSSPFFPGQVDWSFGFPRSLTNREACEAAELTGLLEGFKLWEGLEDRRKWLGDEDVFSVKSLAEDLSPVASRPPVPFYDAVWKAAAPKKVQFFAWLVAIKRVNTADRVQKLNPHLSLSPSFCSLCRSSNEDADHLFLRCVVATDLWRWLFSKLGLDFNTISIEALLNTYESPGFSSKRAAAAKTGVLAGLWGIWNTWNKVFFKDERWNLQSLIDSLNHCIALWLFSSCSEFKSFSLADLARDWSSAL